MTRAIVTADIKPARRMVCGGRRTAAQVKREAHARHRTAVRGWLARGQRDPDAYDDPPQPRPGTGWYVA